MNPEDRAPGWQIRCRKCGFTEPWGKYGIRLAAAGKAYTIGWCPKCRWLRTHAIEKVGAPKAPEEKSAEPSHPADGDDAAADA